MPVLFSSQRSTRLTGIASSRLLAVSAPPALVSATILSDGVTLRLLFSQPITAGTATLGLTRSVGTISSGSISGTNVDLTIPKVYAGDSVGTITYDAGTGDLAGAGGDVASFGPTAIVNNAAAWTPAEIFTGGRLGDYFDPRVVSTMRANVDGTGDIAATGDVVKRVNGVRGAIYGTALDGTITTAARYNESGYLYGSTDACSLVMDITSMGLVSNTSALTILLYGRRATAGASSHIMEFRIQNSASSAATIAYLRYSTSGTDPNLYSQAGWRRMYTTGSTSTFARAYNTWGMTGVRGQGATAELFENALAHTQALSAGGSAVAVNYAFLTIDALTDFGGALIVNDQLTDDEIMRYYNWVNTQA
jgi:hypothetical protein